MNETRDWKTKIFTWQSMHRQLSVNEQVRPRISAASLYSSALDFRCLGGVAGALTVPDSLLPLFSLEEDSRDKEEVDVDPLRRLSLVSNARPAGEANNCNISISWNQILINPFNNRILQLITFHFEIIYTHERSRLSLISLSFILRNSRGQLIIIICGENLHR